MSSRISRIIWPGLIFVFIGTNIAIVTITVILANSSGGAAAEPDYYRKAVNWDQTAAERSRSDALGWSVRVEATTAGAVLSLTGRNGEVLDGAQITVEHFPLLDSGARGTGAAVAQGEGRYELAGPLASGSTEFRIRALRGDDVFVSTVRATVAQKANP